MDRHSDPPSAALQRLVNGYQVTQAIHVAATLGIADLLAEGPRTSDDLAALSGAHAPSLYRLMRALSAVGLFHEDDGRRFTLAPLGEGLLTTSPESLRGWASVVGEPSHWEAWGDLLHSVRTGENAFHHVHGTDPWTFRARYPELSITFDQAMTDLSRQVITAIIASYDFGRFATIVDVGGGTGALLAAILVEHPQIRGVLFDQPHVVTGAPQLLAAMGVTDRCEIVGGSFFSAVPAGGDAYIFKSILHDWEDDQCVGILRVCRRTMADSASVLVVERDLGPANEQPEAKLSDLMMMVGPGGRERTVEEYAALFVMAGFRFVGATSCGSGMSIFAAAPV